MASPHLSLTLVSSVRYIRDTKKKENGKVKTKKERASAINNERPKRAHPM